MPNCSENYENEISDGRNSRSIRCKFCGSIILKASTGTFTTIEFQLPLIKQVDVANFIEKEDLSLFWQVTEIMAFENIGFTNTIGDYKYLTCADCDAGPIGYFDIPSRASYIAVSRVKYF